MGYPFDTKHLGNNGKICETPGKMMKHGGT
jgi:hypothetical protein